MVQVIKIAVKLCLLHAFTTKSSIFGTISNATKEYRILFAKSLVVSCYANYESLFYFYMYIIFMEENIHKKHNLLWMLG